MSNILIDLHESLKKIPLDRNSSEDKYFLGNPPIKEFSIERDGELVHYGVWQGQEDDFMIIFKTPDGKYHFKYKSYFDKILVRELFNLLTKEEQNGK